MICAFLFCSPKFFPNGCLKLTTTFVLPIWNLFYFVRYLSESSEVRDSWITKCADLAVQSQDESLIESLIWTLRSNLSNYKQLSD